MFKTLHGMIPEYLRSRFVYRDNVSAYCLRNTENELALPQPRTDYLKRSFSYSGAQLRNNLPTEIRQATSLNDFKVKLTRHSFNYNYLNTASIKGSFYFLYFVLILFVLRKLGS